MDDERVKEGLKNLPQGFPCGSLPAAPAAQAGLLAGKLCFFKLDGVQHLLEFLAGVETRQQGIDLCGAQLSKKKDYMTPLENLTVVAVSAETTPIWLVNANRIVD